MNPGIPLDAVDFYDELGVNNTKEWWTQHKARYEASVRDPLRALVDELSGEFGEPHLFRPHRDVRFSADKRPYKDHQGAMCTTGRGMGYYLQVSGDGLLVGGGYYPSGKDQLPRQRAAIDAPRSGGELAAIVAELDRQRYELGGDKVATRPRGVSADHPRLDLMRYKSLVASKALGEPEWMGTSDVAEQVAAHWRQVAPLVAWLAAYVGPGTEPER